MEHKALRTVAEKIAHDLVLEMKGHDGRGVATSADVVDLLLQQLAGKVASLLDDSSSPETSPTRVVEAKLQKAERHLEKLTDSQDDEDEDEDEIDGGGSDFPNLKYAKPKYKNVESVLKYIEGQDGTAGFKLIIMNFND